MQLPNKLYSYNQSSLALIPPILKFLKGNKSAVSAVAIYKSVKKLLIEPSDFIGAIDCLFLLGAIDFNENGEIERC